MTSLLCSLKNCGYSLLLLMWHHMYISILKEGHLKPQIQEQAFSCKYPPACIRDCVCEWHRPSQFSAYEMLMKKKIS